MAGICQSILPHAKPKSSDTTVNILPNSTCNITVAFPDNHTDRRTQKQYSVALPADQKSYPHSRIASLRYSADLESRRNLRGGGGTPPYCPSGPPLSRHYLFDHEFGEFGNRPEIDAFGRQYRRSLLSVNSLAVPSSSSSSSSQVFPTTIRYARKPAKKMPHALSMPQTGFQALILCGPGGSLNTFTTVPKEYPKALISVANRPMVWHVLDWCYRMGVTSKSTNVDARLLSSPTGLYIERTNLL
jgi:hypothetical protein